MISYLNNPIGFYGSSNDQYVASSISKVETWRSSNDKEKLGAYISMVQESVKAEAGQENKQTINNIYQMLSNAKKNKDIANVYQALRGYAETLKAPKTVKAISNGDALDFYCKFENPNDTQYCLKFKDGTGTDLQPTSNASIYYIAGGLAVLGLAYYYRKELMKLF